MPYSGVCTSVPRNTRPGPAGDVAAVDEILAARDTIDQEVRGYVTARVGDLGVAHIGGQGEDIAVDIQTVCVPTLESMADKRMTKVMDARRGMVAPGTPLQSASQ